MAERDPSIVILGDSFLGLLDSSRIPCNPLILHLGSFSVELLAELERFLCRRSLLFIQCGRYDVMKAIDNDQLREVAEQIAGSCQRLVEMAPHLKIIVYKLLRSRNDITQQYSPADAAEGDRKIDVFNKHLEMLLNNAKSIVLDSFKLDVEKHLGQQGWDPNPIGAALVARQISSTIRQHKDGLQNSAEAIPCDTLVIGDNLFYGVKKHLPDSFVVIAAGFLTVDAFGTLSRIVGASELKHCLIRIGASDVTKSDYEDKKTFRKFLDAVDHLKQNNPNCVIIVCLLESESLYVDKTWIDAKPKNTTKKMHEFNKFLRFHTDKWNVCKLGLTLESDRKVMADTISKEIRIATQGVDD